MKNRSLFMKNKIINHFMKNGEKKTSEKIFLKSFKELQKNSKKQSKELLKLSLSLITPIFKFYKVENKKRKKTVKEIPIFIANQNARISLAIKFIISTVNKKKTEKSYKNLNKEILLNAQSKGAAGNMKNELQKQILTKKHYFSNYKWK